LDIYVDATDLVDGEEDVVDILNCWRREGVHVARAIDKPLQRSGATVI
jgi:hypothetical protein